MRTNKVICYNTYCDRFVNGQQYAAYLWHLDEYVYGGIGVGEGHRYFGKPDYKFQKDILNSKLSKKFERVVTRFEKDLPYDEISIMLCHASSIRPVSMPNRELLPEGLWWFNWAGIIYHYDKNAKPGSYVTAESITQSHAFKVTQVLSEILDAVS